MIYVYQSGTQLMHGIERYPTTVQVKAFSPDIPTIYFLEQLSSIRESSEQTMEVECLLANIQFIHTISDTFKRSFVIC